MRRRDAVRDLTAAAACPYNPGMTTTDILIQRIPEIVAIVILMGFSAFFSAAETSLFSLTHEDLRKLSLSSSRSSRAIQALLRDPQALLAAVLLGNMLVNLSIYGLSILIAIHLLVGLAFCRGGLRRRLAAGGRSADRGEPKGIAIGRPVEVAHWVAWPMLLFFRVVRPISNLIRLVARKCTDALTRRFSPAPYVTRGELQTLIAMAEQQGTLSGQARGMIEQVVDLTNLRARELMTPRVDMPLFNVAAGAEGFCELVKIDRQERMLAYEGSADNVVGMLFTRDVLLHPEAEIRSLLRPVRFVPETQPVEALLRYFTHARDSVAIVVDEYGGTAGLVTLEHILEEIVGEHPREAAGRRAARPDARRGHLRPRREPEHARLAAAARAPASTRPASRRSAGSSCRCSAASRRKAKASSGAGCASSSRKCPAAASRAFESSAFEREGEA